MTKGRRKLSGVYVALMLLFLYLPIFVLITMAIFNHFSDEDAEEALV